MPNDASKGMRIWFFISIFLVFVFFFVWILRPFLSIIIIAFVVAGVFNPVYNFLKKSFNPFLSSIITCLIIFITLFIPIIFLVGILSKEAWDLYLTAKNAVIKEYVQSLLEGSDIFDRLNVFLSNFSIKISGDDLKNGITELGKVVGLFLYKQASGIASNILKFLLNFFFMLLIIFFLLIDTPKLISFIIDLSPLPKEQNERLINKFKEISKAILIGNGLGGLMQGFMGGFVFALFGLPSPFLWGVIMGLLAFLPILGVGIVFIPASAYLFLSEKFGAGIFFIVFYIILSCGTEYIFKPKLVGNHVKMHTLLIFLSIMGGLKAFGIIGIIYGPLIITGFLTLASIYHTSYQEVIER